MPNTLQKSPGFFGVVIIQSGFFATSILFMLPHQSFTSVQTFDYEGNPIGFNLGNGIKSINMTQMAKPFGKKPKDFLKTDQTQAFISALSRGENIPPDEIVTTISGFDNPGTWGHELLALKFAGWLSPEFEVWMMNIVIGVIESKPAILKPDPHAILRSQFEAASKLLGKKALYEFLYRHSVNESNVRSFMQGKDILPGHVQTLEKWIPYLASIQNVKAEISDCVLRFMLDCTPREATKALFTFKQGLLSEEQRKLLDSLYSMFDEIGETITTFKTPSL